MVRNTRIGPLALRRLLVALCASMSVLLFCAGSLAQPPPHTSPVTAAADSAAANIQAAAESVEVAAQKIEALSAAIDEMGASKPGESEEKKQQRAATRRKLASTVKSLTRHYRRGERAADQLKRMKLKGKDAKRRKRVLEAWARAGKRYAPARQRARTALK